MAAHAHVTHLDEPTPPRAPVLTLVCAIAAAIGLAVFVLLLFRDPQRAWSSLLQGMLYPTFIGVAALFYIAVHSAANAKWPTPLRRLMEGLTSGLWLTLGAAITIALFGGGFLYEWVFLSGTEKHSDLFHVHHGTKEAILTKSRWVVMTVGVVLVWMFFRMKLVGMSLAQDQSKADIRPSHAKWSIAWIIVFALTFTVFVWDMLLSLHHNWFSTMWGPYCFTSAVQTFLCTMVLLVVWLKKGPLKHHIHEHTVHDLGTWMVGWSCFCAYIGFSQYMLIYYANMDEETYYYKLRTQHGYGLAYAIEALIRWPLPFLGLMRQSVRTKPWALTIISIVVLIGNWMDWSWIIMPAFAQNHWRPFFQWELLVGLGFAGATLLLALRFWRRHGLVPKGDPNLLPTVNAEHLH